MEFGRLPSIDRVDFALPRTHAETARVLQEARAGGGDASDSDEACSLRVGTPGWSDPGYVGVLYPDGTRRADFLARYAARLRTVELNSTYYAVDAARIQTWAAAVPDGFLFHPKLPKAISHEKLLVDADAAMESTMAAFAGFGDRLGRTWAALPPTFGPDLLGALVHFVEAWGPRTRLAIELRHEAWFDDGFASREAFGLFEHFGVAAIITDTPGRRDALHMRLAAPDLFLRFVGNALHPTDFERLDAWADRIQEWRAAGLRTADVFLHQKTESQTFTLAQHVEKRLGLKPWRGELAKQMDLFG